ncbi:MAG: nicotinate-nucleotide--dimethylbenzimidazole phosphoribosyltransferase [Actinomycetota bacterium]
MQPADDASDSDLSAFAAHIDLPDDEARQETLALADERGGGYGRLGELAGWVAAVQGRSPGTPFGRVRLVAVASDPPAAPLIELAGVGVRHVDVPAGEVEAAAGFRAGMRVAEAEVDAGADLLVLTAGGDPVPAMALVALLAHAEVASVVGHRPGTDDRDWMRTCAAVRDAARPARPVTGDMLPLLVTLGASVAATAAGVLVGAATRRTPVLLDDLVPCAAALVAQRVTFRAVRWQAAAHRTSDPAHAAALERLRLTPLLDYGLADGMGIGALLAVPHVQAAAALLSD